jgi:hypothetical protein
VYESTRALTVHFWLNEVIAVQRLQARNFLTGESQMLRTIVTLAVALPLAGCAAFNAYVNRDATENKVHLQDDNAYQARREGRHDYSVIAFTANRRAISITNNSPAEGAEGKLLFCAEPPPDAISALLASDSANFGVTSADSQEVKGQVASTFQTAAKSIAARNPLVEVYRTSVYSICQLYIDGVLTKDQAAKAFYDVTKAVVVKMDGKAPAVPVDTGIQVTGSTCTAAANSTCKTTSTSKSPADSEASPPPDKRPDCKAGEKEREAGTNAAGKPDPKDKGCKAPAALPICVMDTKPHRKGYDEDDKTEAADDPGCKAA